MRQLEPGQLLAAYPPFGVQRVVLLLLASLLPGCCKTKCWMDYHRCKEEVAQKELCDAYVKQCSDNCSK
jgi:hypothetical protein